MFVDGKPFKFDLQLFPGDGDPGVGEGTPTGTTPDEGGTPPGGDPPTGKTYTEAEVQSLIRTRVAEASQSTQKKYGDYEKLQKIAARISKATGKDADAILAELDQMAYDAQLQTQASQTGLHPALVNELNSSRRDIQEIKDQNLKLQLDLQEKELMSNPYYANDLKDDELKGAIRAYAKGVGCSLEQAYWAVRGAERAKAIEVETEKRVVAKLKDNGAYAGVLGDGSTADLGDLEISQEELSMARKLGMDPKEYKAMQDMHNIDAYRAMKRKK